MVKSRRGFNVRHLTISHYSPAGPSLNASFYTQTMPPANAYEPLSFAADWKLRSSNRSPFSLPQARRFR